VTAKRKVASRKPGKKPIKKPTAKRAATVRRVSLPRD
jgi:hypothetical protein